MVVLYSTIRDFRIMLHGCFLVFVVLFVLPPLFAYEPDLVVDSRLVCFLLWCWFSVPAASCFGGLIISCGNVVFIEVQDISKLVHSFEGRMEGWVTGRIHEATWIMDMNELTIL